LLDFAASPEVVTQTPVQAIVDAGGGLGHPAESWPWNSPRPGAIGMASVVVRNTAHYGASGYYSQIAADAGLIGMSATTTPGVTVAPGRRAGQAGHRSLVDVGPRG